MNATALLNTALDELFERVRPIMVLVRNGRRGAGAGILAVDGLVLTNLHVVWRARSVQVVLDDDTRYDARVIASDPHVDLALLKIPAHGHAVAVFSEATPRPGELVYAFGHPWGQRNVLTGGVLSAVTSVHRRNGEISILRTDVHIAPGNSGGPLLNAAGEVIGLNAMIFGGDQSVAIPSSLIRSFLAVPRTLAPDASAGEDKVPEGML